MLSSQNRPQGKPMAKLKEVFVCQNCGASSPKWQGQCTACGEWNTLVAETQPAGPRSAGKARPRVGRPDVSSSAGGGGRPRAAPPRDRFGRARPGARRRPGRRVGDLDRRRSRDRKIHADAAGGGCAQSVRPRALCHGRGIAQAGRIAGAPPGSRGRDRPVDRRDPGGGDRRLRQAASRPAC